MKIALAVLATLVIVLFGFQQARISSLEKGLEEQAKQFTKKDKMAKEPPKDEEHYELALAMGRMQTYMQKLYFAGENQNWKLANFYTHELEETIEGIIEHKVVDEGQDISTLVERMALPNIEKLEKTIKEENKDKFVEGYELLLRSCNNCHVASKHEFIKIEKTTNSEIFNQDFSK